MLLLIATVFLGANMAEAKRVPTLVSVCINPVTNVVSRVADSEVCAGGTQVWSASKLAPQLCWNASSLVPTNRTRIVTLAKDGICVSPLRLIPSGAVKLLCADHSTGNLHWPVTRACEPGNSSVWVRTAVTTKATAIVTSNPVSQITPVVSLESTVIRGNTWPKAVSVVANVEGTVYFVEGIHTVNSASDFTSLPVSRWTTGKITKPNVSTSLALNVDDLVNGYYRVYLVDSKGVLSAPANNLVTISITRAYETSVTVRTQTLDQSEANFSNGCQEVSSSSTKGQVFTSGASGPLSRVSAAITKTGTVTQVTASIYSWSGSAVVGSALASKTVLATAVPSYTGCNSTPTAFVDFDFATPASVTAGSQFIIVLTTPDQMTMMSGGQFDWNTSTVSSTGGYTSPVTSPSTSGQRYLFKTYVDI